MQITYQLDQEEVEESLISAHWRSGRFQKWNQVILSLLGAGLIISYGLQPEKFYLAICLALVIGLMFYNSYFVRILRRRRAGRLTRNRGTYGIQLGDKGVYAGREAKFYSLEGSRWEFLESENVYTLKVEREIFCIPRRALSKDEMQALEDLTKIGRCDKRKIITGKER